MSVHRGPVDAIERFDDGFADETSLGALDAGELLSAIVDEVITGYYRLVEDIEQRIDDLDQAALRASHKVDVLAEIVAIRHRVGEIRRTLAPHRTALAALARPEMRAEATVGQPWPGLVDRLEAALSSIETLRDALLGTYDIHMGRAAQRANDVMKVLTVLSAVLLPAVVLAGIMGMNFQIPFFDDAGELLPGPAGDGRRQRAAPGRRPLAPLAVGAQASDMICRAKPNSAPPVARGRPQMRPPMARTRRAHTNRPMPAPAVVRDVDGER